MRRCQFALTTLDAHMVPPIAGLDDVMVAPWAITSLAQVPVVRLFGVTAQGASVCAHVHGFRPFFLAELSMEVASTLLGSSACSSSVSPGRTSISSLEKPQELAEAIQMATMRAGRSKAQVVGLSVEHRCSIYGLHLDPSPFLRVELADFRDVETAAGVVQGGCVPILGCPQAHEAHLPFLLHFLAEHHLCGAGSVRVCGEARNSDNGLRMKQTRCSIELDVSVPDGILNHGDYTGLLCRAGDSKEECARAALRAMLGSPGGACQEHGVATSDGKSSSSEKVEGSVRRPTPGARTTPLQVRESIHSWLGGGKPPVEPWRLQTPQDLRVPSSGSVDMIERGQDIEDLAMTPNSPKAEVVDSQSSNVSGCVGPEMHNSMPIYSDPSDDPSRPTTYLPTYLSDDPSITLSGHTGNTRRPDSPRSVPASGCDAKSALPGCDAKSSSSSPSKNAAKPWTRSGHCASSTTAAGVDAPWEEICAVLSLEVLCVDAKGTASKHDTFNPKTDVAAAIAYVLRPHSCQLGGRRLRRSDQQGVILVARSSQEVTQWMESDHANEHDLGELHIVDSEVALLDKLAAIVQAADPDLCLGWELCSRSWGFLLQRARILGRSNIRNLLSRALVMNAPPAAPLSKTSEGNLRHSARQAIDPEQRSFGWQRPRESADPRTYDSEMIAPAGLQFTGRLVLNVWRVLMHLTFGSKLRSYAPQEAARELLGYSVPCVSVEELSRSWCTGGVTAQHAALRHLQCLANLSIQVFDALEVLPRAAELSRLFGMDVLSGFTRGTQLRVESLLTRVARAAGFALLSASHAQVRAQPAVECLPLVMEPFSGFYWDPVLVFDFKGMYPSLIVAYNISFDTCLGRARRTDVGPNCSLGVRDKAWSLGADAASGLLSKIDDVALTDASADSAVRLLPGDVLFVAPEVRRGLLPLMLAEVIRLRTQAKAAMKTATPGVKQRLNLLQFALKYFANVTYGYAGASFSGRMPCAEVADAIVACGRRALEEAASIIEAAEPTAKVIYGDTDSLFVQLRGSNLEEAFRIGRRLCTEISARHPSPVELEFEKVYLPCLCLSKKRYGGLAYARPPSEGGEAQFEAKGIEAVRRDQCRLASKLQEELLRELFRSKDMSAVKRLFIQRISDLLRGEAAGPPLTDLVFFREARLGTYRAEDEDGGSATLPPQATVAHNRIASEGEAAAPEFGERVAYVVSCGPSGLRLIDRCVPPTEVAEGGNVAVGGPRLDRWWYAEKAVLPVIARIFHNDLCGLPPVDVAGWLRQVPRPGTAGTNKSGGALSRLLRRVCSSCRTKEAAPGVGVCRECLSVDEGRKIQEHARDIRGLATRLQNVCASCTGPQLWRSCVAAAHCPTLSQRLVTEEQLRLAEEDLRFLSLESPRDVVLLSDSDACSDDHQEVKLEISDPSNNDALMPPATHAPPATDPCGSCGSDYVMTSQGTIVVSDDEDAGVADNAPGSSSVARNGNGSATAASGSDVVGGRPGVPLTVPPAAASAPNCSGHNEPCRELEVKKEGPNIGRRFFACARPREEQCNFFAWADRMVRARTNAPRSEEQLPNPDSTMPPATPRRKRATASRTGGGSATRTPQKRRRGSKDGRLERYLAKPSKQVTERIVRALEHRLLLISAEVDAQGAVVASVLGHTGNVYDTCLGARVRCTCPDFSKAGRACKHLLFVMLRVLQVPQDDARLWQRALLPREVKDLRERFESNFRGSDLEGVRAPEAVVSALASADQSKPVVRQKLGEACPICLDPVETLSGSTYCDRCGRNLHKSCAEQWRAATSGKGAACPLCRGDLASSSGAATKSGARVVPGQPLPRKVNLAAVSVLHAQPATLEETYPSTHQWIARRGPSSAAASASGPPALS